MNAAPTRTELVAFALVLAGLAVIYLPGLGNPLVFDDSLLTDEKFFREYGALFDAKARMLSYGSFAWVQALLGEGWWKQRLVNLALHAASVAAIWGFYRELLPHVQAPAEAPDRRPALAFAIAFFALNPVAVYAVAYLVQRSVVMATAFVALALWLFARALARRNAWLHLGAVACYALAVMSKEYALTAPLAAVPVYILVARPSGKRLAAVGACGIALATVCALVLLERYGEIVGKPFDEYSQVYLGQLAALQPGADARAYPLSVLNQAYLFFHYGLRWFLPLGEWMSINLRPPFPLALLTFPHVLGALGYVALAGGAAFALWRYRDWRALAGMSVLMALLLFSTEFITVWVQDPFVLYRSYLWAIGVPGLVLALLTGVPHRALVAIALVVGGLLVWQSLDRVFSLSSVDRAWSDAIAKLPDDARSVGRWFPYLNRGAARVDRGQYNLAMQDFEASARLGDNGAGLFNRGSLYAANGEHANALASFDAAERQGYNLYNLPFQRALSLLALGRTQEAYPHIVRAWNMNPPSPTRELVLFHMGRTALQLGSINDAVSALEGVLQAQPANPDARFYLAMALVSRKEYPRALEVLRGMPREKFGMRAHYASALAHYGMGQREQALAEIEAAIRIGPDTPHLREWQARIRAMKSP